MSHKVILTHEARKFTAWLSHPQSSLDAPGAYSRVVIFLHGFPDNNDSWAETIPLVQRHFAAEGEKILTLAPLLRGYEPSSQGKPDEYCMFELALDVQLWIQQVHVGGSVPVHLVGHDWGAIVAFKTASKYPELVTSLVTLAIPYITNLRAWHFLWYCPVQIWNLSYMLRMQNKWFYKHRFGDLAKPGYLDELWRYWSPGWDFSKQIDSVRDTLSQPGVLDSATAYYRNIVPWKKMEEFRWPVDFEKTPTLILGGVQDGCMDAALFELESRLLAAKPRVKVQLIYGAGHFLHREDPSKVGELICDWFDKYAQN